MRRCPRYRSGDRDGEGVEQDQEKRSRTASGTSGQDSCEAQRESSRSSGGRAFGIAGRWGFFAGRVDGHLSPPSKVPFSGTLSYIDDSSVFGIPQYLSAKPGKT